MPKQPEPNTIHISQRPGRPCRVRLSRAPKVQGKGIIDMVSFPIPSTPINTGTNRSAYANVTSQVAGRSNYTLSVDLTAWAASDDIAFGIEFRIDNVQSPNSGSTATTTGGPHHAMGDPGTPMLPSCGGHIPPFTTKLEARAFITVPSAGTVSGSIDLS